MLETSSEYPLLSRYIVDFSFVSKIKHHIEEIKPIFSQMRFKALCMNVFSMTLKAK